MSERNLSSEVINLVLSNTVFTDIHIEEGAPIMINTPHKWQVVADLMPPTRDDMEPLLNMLDKEWAKTIRTRAIDRPITLTEYRLRCNAYSVAGGARLVITFRRQPKNPIPLEKIGLPAPVRSWTELPRGLVLVVGSTRSGKTTTIASMADAINRRKSVHIVTVEDPIEYVLDRQKAIISQKEVSRGGGVSDVASFADGLRDALRQNPDVLVIGEIRDADAAQVALTAAESGALVFATMHANSIAVALQKFIKFFPADAKDSVAQSLSTSLIGVVAQYLLPSADSKGFVLATELLNNATTDTGTAKAISSNASAGVQKLIDDSATESLAYSLNSNLIKLIKDGKVAKDAARTAAHDRGQLEIEIKKASL